LIDGLSLGIFCTISFFYMIQHRYLAAIKVVNLKQS
jgi:hypothetical protein